VNPPSGDVAGRLAACEKELSVQAASIRRSGALTLGVGIVLLGLLAGYFWYGYQQISSVMNPDTLVAAASGWVEDQLPEVRKSLETEVDKSAPVWAASLSKQARDSLPSLRSKLEEHVMQQVDATIEQTVNMTDAEFRKFLQDNRPTLEQGFKDLKGDPALAQESLQRIEDAVQEQFAVNMQQGASDLFATLGQMRAKLVRLKAGTSLTQEEKLERHVLTLLRGLQLSSVPPASAEEIN
jgi:hypothetical protein